MKKLLLIIFAFAGLTVVSQENETLRFGVQWGFHGNESNLTGGMDNANARFFNNSFGGGSIKIEGRYDFDKHWMLMTGFGFSSYGFEYALAENHSLKMKNDEKRFSVIRSEIGALEIPLEGFYKFNPNCRNARWVLGVGLANNFIGDQNISKKFIEDKEGNGQVKYLNSETRVKGGVYTMLRFTVGREKIFKRGGIFNASMVFNAGFRNMAISKVVYTIDGQEYNHEFTNNGNFVGFRFGYYFRPFKREGSSTKAN